MGDNSNAAKHSPDELLGLIVKDPRILVGKPTIRGTRLAVEFIVERLAAGWTKDELLENFPSLTEDGIRACLAYAAQSVRAERVFTLEPA